MSSYLLVQVVAEAGTEIVAGSSLKAALDLDWDDPVAKAQALSTILQSLDAVEFWVQQLRTFWLIIKAYS